MSQANHGKLHWGWALTAILAFGVAFAAGSFVGVDPGSLTEGSVVPPRDETPISEDERYKIPVSMSQPARGAAHPLVTLVEWCDLSGPACQQADKTVTALLGEYPELRHVWRHFPAQAAQESLVTHEAARIVHEQAGKFWELRSLFLQQATSPSRESVRNLSTQVGMDVQALDAALEKRTYLGSVAADGMFAAKFGVTASPTFFVNGHRFAGTPTRARLKRLIEREQTHAQAMLDSGVARDKLYEEITREGRWKVADAQ